MPEIGEGFAEDLEVEGIGLQTGALAVGAFGVGTVTREEDADVHLVGFRFEPVEEALNAIPAAFLPESLGLLEGGEGGFVTAFSVLHPALLIGLEFVPRGVGVDVDSLAVAEKVSLAVPSAFALEGFDGTLSKGEEVVWNCLIEVDPDDAAEAPAVVAGAEGGIEGEEGRGGLDEGSPTGGERLDFVGCCRGHTAGAFSKGEGLFERFGEAGFVTGGHLQAILNDEDLGREFFESGWGVGADDFAVQKNAEVALGIKEGEEVLG